MTESLFEITGGGQTTLCWAEDFSNLAEQLKLLSKVKKATEITPTLDEHRWLMRHFDKAHGLRPFCTNQKLALFQPMSAEEYTQSLCQFETVPSSGSHAVWDYDGNRFVFSEWQDDKRLLITGPLSDAIKAYERTLRHLNSSQSALNEQAFESNMAVVCEILEIENEQENDLAPTMRL